MQITEKKNKGHFIYKSHIQINSYLQGSISFISHLFAATLPQFLCAQTLSGLSISTVHVIGVKNQMEIHIHLYLKWSMIVTFFCKVHLQDAPKDRAHNT